jgi:hypothetical protein
MNWNATKQGNKVQFGRRKTPQERAQDKVKAKPFEQMSRAEKDELLKLLLIKEGIIEDTN